MGAEIIAKISGKAIHYGGTPGGIPDVSMDELMGALAGLPRGPELLIRASVCGQDSDEVMRELYLEAAMAAVNLGVKKGWRAVVGKPVFRGMAKMAIDEIVYPKSYFCPACGGTGLTRQWVKNPEGECKRCDGKGTKVASTRAASAFVGIPETTYRQTWKPREYDVRMIFLGWYSRGIKHVIDNLSADR